MSPDRREFFVRTSRNGTALLSKQIDTFVNVTHVGLRVSAQVHLLQKTSFDTIHTKRFQSLTHFSNPGIRD